MEYHRPIRIPLSFLSMNVDPSSLLMPIITGVLLLNFPSRSRLAGESGESRSNYKLKVTFQFALVHGSFTKPSRHKKMIFLFIFY